MARLYKSEDEQTGGENTKGTMTGFSLRWTTINDPEEQMNNEGAKTRKKKRSRILQEGTEGTEETKPMRAYAESQSKNHGRENTKGETEKADKPQIAQKTQIGNEDEIQPQTRTCDAVADPDIERRGK